MSTIAEARNLAVKQARTAVKHQVRHKDAARPKRRLKVVEEKKRRTTSSAEIPFPVFVLSVTAFTAGIIINVAQQALVSQLSYEVESVKKEIQLAQQTQEKLLARKAELSSPQRIEAIAMEKLSMVKAPKISYLRIALDQPVETMVGNAAGALATHDGTVRAPEQALSH